jgi:SWI/SNF-related matrix-associated actin-dependent regulator of chromatin subfamily B protein 1
LFTHGARPDAVVTPEAFAQTVVDDYQLAATYVSVIAKQIQEQLADYQAHVVEEDDAGAGAGAAPKGAGAGDTHAVGRAAEGELARGRLEGEEQRWWDAWREKVWAPRKRRRLDNDATLAPVGVNGLEFVDEDAPEEMRILIKVRDGLFYLFGCLSVGWAARLTRTHAQLDISVGGMKLDDQFEWDIDNQHSSPEQFAEVYATDLGLAGEFK